MLVESRPPTAHRVPQGPIEAKLGKKKNSVQPVDICRNPSTVDWGQATTKVLRNAIKRPKKGLKKTRDSNWVNVGEKPCANNQSGWVNKANKQRKIKAKRAILAKRKKNNPGHRFESHWSLEIEGAAI